MQFSIRDVLLFPLIALTTIPICVTATAIGLTLLPQFTTNWPETRDWFLDQGLSVDFVCGELTFFWSEIPAVLVLVVLAAALFPIRTRICDQTAVITLVSLPFVEALQVGTLSDYFNVDGDGPSLGWHYLTTQSLTGITLAAIISVYVIARWRSPNPMPTRTRTVISTASLSFVLLTSGCTWQYLT